MVKKKIGTEIQSVRLLFFIGFLEQCNEAKKIGVRFFFFFFWMAKLKEIKDEIELN